MKITTLSALARQYQAGLRAYLEQVPPADLHGAHDLGANAVVMGLETLDLVKLHDQALAVLPAPDDDPAAREQLAVRAALFFAEAIVPIEKTHRLALEAGAELDQVNDALTRRTIDLADSHRELQEGIAWRKNADECLRASGEESVRLLEDARQIEQHLKNVARRIITAQEEERRAMSFTLQDEIVQTLFGIQLRLLALQNARSVTTAGFQKEIAKTERLVQESVHTIDRFTREFGIPMKSKLPRFARAYLKALRLHLQPGSSGSLAAARKLGLRAVTLGMETLELARIHEEALLALVSPDDSTRTSDSIIRRAGAFFTEALTPVEETHRGALEANLQLKVMIGKLTQRTDELAASNTELQNEIVQRKAVEDSLRTSETTSSRLLDKSRRMQEELRLLSHRLLSAQEEERKRISRELHDVIGQTLAGINLQLASLKSQTAANAKELNRKIDITQRLVEKSVAVVHRFARDLRPAVLDDLGLIPALHAYLKGFMEDTGVRVAFTAFAGVERQDSAVRTVLYRVVQEALTNVARHAKASRVSVRIVSRKGAMEMEVEDNGEGFQVEGALFARTSERIGLLGMQERVEMVGGTFCVDSAPGKPTTIHVAIPQNQTGPKKPPSKKAARTPLKCS